MKPYTYSLLAALFACGMAQGAATAYTTPVGYSTQALSPGFNMCGLTLQTATVAAGNFETVSGTALTDTGVTFAPVAGRLYVLEITSGTLIGTIQEVPAASIVGSTITTPQDLQAAGLIVGDTYKLRLAPTLEEIFTTVPLATGGVLFAAVNATSADNIWVPNGSGDYDKYYLRSGTTPAFRSVATNLVTPNVPLIYADGILVEKKTVTAASLTVSGEVKTIGTNSVMIQGFNLLGTVAPVGLNLFNAGLEDDVFAAVNATSADNIWVQQADLSYKKYFRRSGTTPSWRDVDAPTVALTQAQAEAVVFSNGFLIERKPAGSANVDLNVPSSYSGL